ncbi:MAG: helix-turn-helix transcriptional regulator [Candidatus Korobacteraceae bacterium]
MDFHTLQERLRARIQARITAGELTGLELARQSGFRQAHICNFLNRKRGLSLEGMDRVLGVQQLSVLDLLEPDEVNRRATSIAPDESDFENVVLVEGVIAASEPTITSENVKEVLKFKKSFLRKLRSDMATERDLWHRFVLLKVDPHDGMGMHPRLLPGATLLIDRHYNSLRPYRKKERNMYAVRRPGGCTVKYVELADRNLVLRPHNDSYPVSVLSMEEGLTFADHIVGRVCHVATET